MSEYISLKLALLSLEDLAEEACGNGNNWDDWCVPKMKNVHNVLNAQQSRIDQLEALTAQLLNLLNFERRQAQTTKEDALLYRTLCDVVDNGEASVVFMNRLDTINTGLEVNSAADLSDELNTIIKEKK